MPADSTPSPLRRMAGLPAAPVDDPTAVPSPLEKALAMAVLRVADGVPALGLAVRDRAARGGCAPDAAFADLPDHALCLMLDPPLSDGVPAPAGDLLAQVSGALILDPALVDSLIEVQTIGRVDGPMRPPRRPTRIDAALAQPFARDLAAQIARQLPRDHHGPRPGRLRMGTYLAGPVSLPMVLTAASFLRVTLDLVLADGGRASRVVLILPEAVTADDGASDALVPPPDPIWAAAMDAAARAAPVRLDAVLPPVRLTLAALVALRPGDLIPLDDGALSDLRLLGGSSGLASPNRLRMPRGLRLPARLGQLNGSRAVRILADPAVGSAVDAGLPAPQDASRDGVAGTGGGAALPALTGASAPGSPSPLSDLPMLDDLPPLPDLP